MKITEKIINKIEGEALLEIYEDRGVVKFATTQFYNYRGMEEYLKGRHYMDALVINPRVCGICGHSHLLATAMAIENAYGIKPSKKAEILREITTGLEIVQNHIKWFYITFYPSRIEDKSLMLKAINISSFVSKIIALIGGQFPHTSYIIPGGVTCDITNVELLKIKNMLKSLKNRIENEIMDKNGNSADMECFFEDVDKNIGKGLNRFLVLGENLWFEKNGEITKVVLSERNALYENRFFEVGPLARNLKNKQVKNIYEKYSDSLYTRVFARLYELYLLSEYLLGLADKIDVCEKSYIKYEEKKKAKGEAAIEAPRGSLVHRIEIENSKIKNYEIIVPTQFNLANGDENVFSASQAALIGEKKEYADMIFKCFDICAVCANH